MFFYRFALVLEIETLTETNLHAQKEETPQISPFGPRGGQVACATESEIGLALVEDSPETSTEGCHDDFARFEPDCWIVP